MAARTDSSTFAGAALPLVKHGHCWSFGDNVHCDGDMIPLHLAMAREIRPEVLREFLFSELDPTLAARIAPGDLIVGGKGFGAGHPHAQGMYALAGAGVGVLAESVPRGTFRNLVLAGVPFLPDCPGINRLCSTGDELEVDFSTGSFLNVTTGVTAEFRPLDARLLETIAIGGWMPMFKRRLEAMRTKDGGS